MIQIWGITLKDHDREAVNNERAGDFAGFLVSAIGSLETAKPVEKNWPLKLNSIPS